MIFGMVSKTTYPILRRTLIPWTLRHLGGVEGVENIPKTGSYIMTPNHISRADPALLSMVIAHYTKRKMHFLTAQYVYDFFALLRAATWLGLLKIDKYDKKQSLRHAEDYLRNGGALGIYPEGSMNPRSELLPGKTGAIRLSLATGAPIIPAALFGTQTRTTLASLWGLFRHPEKHRFVIGEPYTPKLEPGEELNRDSLHRLTFDMMQRIAELCEKSATRNTPNA